MSTQHTRKQKFLCSIVATFSVALAATLLSAVVQAANPRLYQDSLVTIIITSAVMEVLFIIGIATGVINDYDI